MHRLARPAATVVLLLASAACHDSHSPTSPSSPSPTPRAGWSNPRAITPASAPDAATTSVRLAGNAAGAALAVWEQRATVSSRVLAMAFDPLLGWGQPELLSDDGGVQARAHVALGDDGNGWALWRQRDGRRHALVARRFVAGAGWEASQALSGSDDVEDFDAAVDAFGGAQAVWASRAQVRAARFVPGFGWRAPVTLSDPAARSTAALPRVVLAPDGGGVALWRQNDENALTALWACSKPGGGSWDTPLTLASATPEANSVDLAASPGGEVTLVFTRRDSATSLPLAARRFVPGLGWYPPAVLAPRVLTARVAALPEAQALAVWIALDASTTSDALWASHFRRSDAWSEPQRLAEATHQDWTFDLASGPGGQAFALWEQWRDGSWGVHARRFDGARWSDAVQVAHPAETYVCDDRRHTGDLDPHVTVDDRGQALALWRRADCAGETFWSSRFLGP